ncbi:hypothetical protein C8F01DRAFT_1252438 [Mycena amicta]|nr:hypothetical protein C8F01DRAFT_1252438 [Mycena amicta]
MPHSWNEQQYAYNLQNKICYRSASDSGSGSGMANNSDAEENTTLLLLPSLLQTSSTYTSRPYERDAAALLHASFCCANGSPLLSSLGAAHGDLLPHTPTLSSRRRV